MVHYISNAQVAAVDTCVIDHRDAEHLGIPLDYAGRGDRTKRYPYEDKAEGLTSGKTYYFLIRARNAG